MRSKPAMPILLSPFSCLFIENFSIFLGFGKFGHTSSGFDHLLSCFFLLILILNPWIGIMGLFGLGELPKEYNRKIHGPYDPAVYYGKSKFLFTKWHKFGWQYTRNSFVVEASKRWRFFIVSTLSVKWDFLIDANYVHSHSIFKTCNGTLCHRFDS